jgi:hypothetical protein
MTTVAEKDNAIDGILNTMAEAFDQTNDIHGPNWQYMAEQVYDAHVAPLLDVVEAVGQMRDELFPWFPDEADLPDVVLVGRSVLKPILDAFLAAEAAP